MTATGEPGLPKADSAPMNSGGGAGGTCWRSTSDRSRSSACRVRYLPAGRSARSPPGDQRFLHRCRHRPPRRADRPVRQSMGGEPASHERPVRRAARDLARRHRARRRPSGRLPDPTLQHRLVGARLLHAGAQPGHPAWRRRSDRLLLFWSMFLPLNARFSLDRALNPHDAPGRRLYLSGGSLGFVLPALFLYWFTAIAKWHPIWICEGSAIYYALSLAQFATPLGTSLLQFPRSPAADDVRDDRVRVRRAAPRLLSAFDGAVRLAHRAAFIGFHTGLGLTMRLGNFPWVCATGWLVLLPPLVLGDRWSADAPPPMRAERHHLRRRGLRVLPPEVPILRRLLRLAERRSARPRATPRPRRSCGSGMRGSCAIRPAALHTGLRRVRRVVSSITGDRQGVALLDSAPLRGARRVGISMGRDPSGTRPADSSVNHPAATARVPRLRGDSRSPSPPSASCSSGISPPSRGRGPPASGANSPPRPSSTSSGSCSHHSPLRGWRLVRHRGGADRRDPVRRLARRRARRRMRGPPTRPSSYRNAQWRKYLGNIWDPRLHQSPRCTSAGIFAASGTPDHVGGDRLNLIYINMMFEPTPPPGTPRPPAAKQLVWRHYCFDKPPDW